MQSRCLKVTFLFSILPTAMLGSPRFPRQVADTSAAALVQKSSGTGPSKATTAQASGSSGISSRRLISSLSSTSPKARKATIKALVKHGDPAPATVIARLIQDPDQDVAVTACWALGELRNPETSPQAVLALQKSSIAAFVRATCAIAVGRIGDPQGVAALNEVAENEREETDVRLASIQALAMFNGEQATSLIPLLRSSDPEIRASAAYSACQLQIPTAVEPIKSMLVSPDVETKRYALVAAGLWPERFSEELAKTAANPHEPSENRILSMASLAALPKDRKNADFLKSVSELVRPEQPNEVQLAAAEILSEVPEARPFLEKIAKDGRQAPDMLKKLNDIGLETSTPITVTPSVPMDRDYSWFLRGLIGVVICVGLLFLTIYVRDRLRQEKADRVRKKILREMLQDRQFNGGWRSLHTLMKVIGTDQETTTRLLIEIGARGSQEKESDLWGLREMHPLGQKEP